ncbi:MAG: DUF2283 domain-containing protein [Candidatus Marsarchaeota archaeon]|nr:DUF2283 domain-containing protein [Candidatus Marsarchaeota archaeon]
MIYKYDPKTDILVLILGKGRLDFGEQKENIITHYDKKGKPLEIEILEASKTAMKMMSTIMSGRKRVAVAAI